jgi:hypothetical protein
MFAMKSDDRRRETIATQCTCVLQPSFDKVLQEEIPELEMVHLAALYMELRSIGQIPPIIDATDIRNNPEVLHSPALLFNDI